MSARIPMDSDKAVDPRYALETAMGRLHDIVTNRLAEHSEQIEAARVLGDLVLNYMSLFGAHEEQWTALEIPVIR